MGTFKIICLANHFIQGEKTVQLVGTLSTHPRNALNMLKI